MWNMFTLMVVMNLIKIVQYTITGHSIRSHIVQYVHPQLSVLITRTKSAV